jgi:hypothetical protein
LATQFGQDVRVAILSYRSLALWVLGYPDAALADGDRALKDARETYSTRRRTPLLDLVEVAAVGVVRIVGLLVGPVVHRRAYGGRFRKLRQLGDVEGDAPRCFLGPQACLPPR